MNSENKQRVVIVGGGITGLSTAYYTAKQAREQGRDLEILLLEASEGLGGKVQTELVDGFVIERGPDSFLARKVAAVHLARELGIADELVGTNPEARKTYILHKNRLHRIPKGMNIGVPTEFVPFATTGLLSIAGKLRAGMDLFKPKGIHQGDQSLGAFLEKRLGTEVVDNLAEPLLAGIYAGDLRKLSLRATFPHLEQLEQQHGSLVKGMLAQAREAKAQAARARQEAEATHAQQSSAPKPELGANPAGHRPLPPSVFLTFRTGLVRLIERLETVLTDWGVIIRTNTSVHSIAKGEHGRYQLRLDADERVAADSIVLTVPTYEAAKLLPDSFTPRTQLAQVPYVSVATVVLAFKKGSFDYPFDASGFVVPRKEGRTITAATWTSTKWLHTAKDGNVLMRFYVGRSNDEAIVDQSDARILDLVRQDLREIMDIDAEPLFTRVQRWKRSMPQYTVGHLDRVRQFEAQAAKELPGVLFAGGGYTGLGIPDCISQGLQAAGKVHDHLQR